MAWSRHCRARTSACGMGRVRASQVYRTARPACPLPSEGSRSPGNAVIGVMDSAMASTACRACWAAVPDKMGRQQLAALASSGFVIRPAPLRSQASKKAGAECKFAWHCAAHSSRAAPRCLPGGNCVVVRPERWDQAAHMACALPDPFESRLSCQPVVRVRVTGSPWYAFGSGAARRLGVRAAVRSAVRRGVVATLRATDDLGQVLLVERPQGLLRQGQLLLHELSSRDCPTNPCYAFGSGAARRL